MFSRAVSPALLIALVFTCVACGGSLRDVPTLRAADVRWEGLPGLEPKTVRLAVQDARSSEYREHSEEVIAALTDAVTKVLESEQIQVESASPHLFTVSVSEPREDFSGQGFDRKSCVEIRGRLEQPTAWYAEASGFSCQHVKYMFGLIERSNISLAYTESLKALFRVLRQQMDRLPQRSARPARRADSSPGEARLRLRVQPGAADVWLDGTRIVYERDQALSLDPGVHVIEASAPGVENVRRVLELSAGTEQQLFLGLPQRPSVQSVRTRPARTNLWLPAVVAGLVAGLTSGLLASL